MDWGPGTRVGRYRCEAPLSTGSMSSVWRARDEGLQRDVALKVVPLGDGEREGQLLGALSHPHVVQVYDIGRLRDRSFVVMELVDGVVVADWLAERRPCDEIVGVFRQAAEGLAAAHDAGVLHGDFKPSNVILGRDGRARVIDFGLGAKGPSARPCGGTPDYQAPEQLAGAGISRHTDQFAFSVSLFRALYGRHPFTRRADVITGQVGPPRWARGPAELRAEVVRGLAPHPEARHPSMRAFVDALGPFVR